MFLCSAAVVGDVKITNVKVGDCIKAPCQVKRGTNATVTFSFTTSKRHHFLVSLSYCDLSIAKSFDSLKVLVEGKVGILIPFPISPSDVCQLGASCPIKPGVTNTVSFTVATKSEYPPVSDIQVIKKHFNQNARH